MKKLYLHIGPHKTGSTYIQKTLFDASELLESKGLHYSKKLIGPQWGHHQLVEAIKTKNGQSIADMLDSFNDETFISSENFENLTQENIDYFSSFLTDFKVILIFVKRSFSELLISNWQESIKHGSDIPWSAFILDQLLKPYSSLILNQASTIERWESLSDVIEVIDYDILKNSNLDIVDYVVENILGISDLKISTGQNINASMNYCDIELIRVLNGFYLKNGSAPGTKVRDIYLKLKANKEVLIDSLLETVNENLVDFTPSISWGVSHFESSFRSKYQKSQNENNYNTKTYMLPNSNMNYLFLIHEDIRQLYELVKRDA
jgi:hypothetical protein